MLLLAIIVFFLLAAYATFRVVRDYRQAEPETTVEVEELAENWNWCPRWRRPAEHYSGPKTTTEGSWSSDA